MKSESKTTKVPENSKSDGKTVEKKVVAPKEIKKLKEVAPLKITTSPITEIPRAVSPVLPELLPIKTSEPVKASEPVKEPEPIKVVEPVKALEPVKVAEPVKTSEPIKEEKTESVTVPSGGETKKKKKGFKKITSLALPPGMDQFVNMIKTPLQQVDLMMMDEERMIAEDQEAQSKFHKMELF